MSHRPDPRHANAWPALSELFVGRELQDYDYQAIARSLQQVGLSTDELERVLWDQVAPVFGSNLAWLNAAPEMEGWTPEHVRGLVQARLAKGRSSLSERLIERLLPASQRALIEDRWSRVKALIPLASS
jgi:hypothetical protein